MEYEVLLQEVSEKRGIIFVPFKMCSSNAFDDEVRQLLGPEHYIKHISQVRYDQSSTVCNKNLQEGQCNSRVCNIFPHDAIGVGLFVYKSSYGAGGRLNRFLLTYL